jgi:coenzyme F420-reducing hydrogenase delta subunit/ferredoxin
MYEPKIIGFLCTWCSYTGADLAGTARLKSPWNLRAIRVPCSGRVSPELIMKAFDQGADGVIVLGCHIGECHYDSGNHRAAKRMPILQSMMAYAGLEPERLRLDWVSASESNRFSQLVTEFTDKVKKLGPIKWRLNSEEWPIKTPEEHSINLQIKQINQDWINQERIKDIQAQIRKTAADLLENGLVNCVIGYEVGPRNRTRPAFIYKSEDTNRLVWNQSCTHNLTTYLPEKFKTPKDGIKSQNIAIITKPCDSRTVNVLVSENKCNRDDIHIIGLACDGIREGASFGKTDGSLQARCVRCEDRKPILYDTLLGDPETIQPEVVPLDDDIVAIERMTAKERASFWLNQFDRCIRCYACRQVCPMCSCPTCLYERDDSLWVGMNIELKEVRTFHLGRAFHLAGRCIGCNECERVCPMDIPISLLNRKLVKEIENTFGHKAGEAPTPSPLTTILSEEVSLHG